METIQLTSYNIWGQKLKEGSILFDFDKEEIKTQGNRTFKVIKDFEFTYKIQKTQIKASGGINGLYEFIHEINRADSPFNPCVTELFIEL